jgi:hypothetical protein
MNYYYFGLDSYCEKKKDLAAYQRKSSSGDGRTEKCEHGGRGKEDSRRM